MADCSKCKHNYKMPGDEPRCNRMCDGESDFESITNADKIRSMSDEELASMLIEYVEPRDVYYCSDCEFFNTIEDAINHEIEWLQSEAE